MTDTAAHLADNYAPVDSESTVHELQITGSLPLELSGRLLRIGPNPVSGDRGHWFAGEGMVHGVRLHNGAAQWYRNRYVRSDRVTEAMGWPTVVGPRHGRGDGGANTNVIHHAGTTYAIVEGGAYPVALTDDLETIARDNFGGTLDGSYSAHPKRHPDTGELHAVTYFWEWEHVRYVIVGVDGTVRREVKVPVPGRPMIHDCAITDTKVLILDLPVQFDVEAAMKGISIPYQWDVDYQARIGVLPHEGEPEDVVWCNIDPCFVFHPLNAYDVGDGTIVADVVRHPRMFAGHTSLPSGGKPSLVRWTIDPLAASVTESVLSDVPQEFPRVDERVVGKKHRFGYGVYSSKATSYAGAIKHDLDAGTSEWRDHGHGRTCQEPVFVPRHATADEDDGWLLAYVHDDETGTTDIEVWESRNFTGEPLALVHLEARVPFGFHGNWVPDER